jgi:hypothetical protein
MDWLHLALMGGIVGAGGLGAVVAGALHWRHRRAESVREVMVSGLESDLLTARERVVDLERRELSLEQELEKRRREVRALVTARDELSGDLETLRRHVVGLERSQGEGRARLAELEHQREAARQAEQRAGEGIASLQARLRAVRRERDHLREELLPREVARRESLERALAAVGLPVSEVRDPLGTSHRLATREALGALLASLDAASVGVVDGRGFVLAAEGDEHAARTLARLAAGVDQAREALTAALGGPPRAVSAVFGVQGWHLHRLSRDGRRWLGVAGPVHLPDRALRLGVLELTGDLSILEGEAAGVGAPPPASTGTPALDRWLERWQGLRLHLDAGTDDGGAAMDPLETVSAALGPLYGRLQRQGVDPQDGCVRVSSQGDLTLAAQAFSVAPIPSLAVVLARAALPPAALDELRGLARWAASPPSEPTEVPA